MERGSREYALWSIGILLVLAFALIPVLWLISVSLKPPEAVTDGRFIPSEFSLDNYKSLFEGGIDDSPFIKPLINSIGIALITTVIAITLAAFTAYAIARLEFPGKRLILAGALAIAMFPPISTVGPLFDMWRALGLYDTWPGLIIPYLTFSLPLAIYVLVAFFREIPWELEQAAQVDGATPFQAFTKVIVPLAAPGVFTAAILVFIFAWNDFLFAISLTSSDASRTVPAALAFFTGESSFTAADREHRRRRGGGDGADHRLRPLLPAPNRRRPHLRRRQGIRSNAMAEIVLDGVTKVFADGYEAVKDMDLDIADGEFMILVGPSGCGKSTALRMIAGLEDISSGELKIGGEQVNDRAPKDRDIAMVFQNYALYPHMTVRENMGFALKLAGADKEEIDRKVEDAAKTLDLTQHLDRRPANLSGGQRQRVAMGRAIVRDPKAFLMDEPLSNLDAKLRVQMRTEVARLQSKLETTTVYVTHDQTEAMTLGDRVAVMRAGLLQQVGTPAELYDNPKNLFVAGFIGSPAMNFMPGELSGRKVKLPIGEADLGEEIAQGHDGPVVAGLRPESFEDASLVGDLADERGIVFEAEIDLVESLGSDLFAYFHVESRRRPVRPARRRDRRPARGDRHAGTARGPGAARRPPRPDQQGQAPRHRQALGRHRQAPPLRPGERREPEPRLRRRRRGLR